ncbi:hypothetical protein E2C01_079931 [Portunus trituberculatus]|uniref:Uncharacterized protein n=1 Tax=Portunus trituberculatus TaxID=210409 RepID=A0A5B7IWX0_PORTR|nr:hypothetical protein [Portunus trituberculatus]
MSPGVCTDDGATCGVARRGGGKERRQMFRRGGGQERQRLGDVAGGELTTPTPSQSHYEESVHCRTQAFFLSLSISHGTVPLSVKLGRRTFLSPSYTCRFTPPHP